MPAGFLGRTGLAAIFVLALVLPGQGGECPVPPLLKATLDSNSVQLRWDLEMVPAGSGGMRTPFMVIPDTTGRRLAIGLPASSGEDDGLRAITAYYLGTDGTSAHQWATLARFRWTLQPDEAGHPADSILEQVDVPLGGYPNLRLGGTLTTVVDWPIPSSGSQYWLVGWWPDSTEIVRLATTNQPGEPLILLTYNGLGEWSPYGTGIYLEVEIAHPSRCQGIQSGLANGLTVERLKVAEEGGGPLLVGALSSLPPDACSAVDHCLFPGSRVTYRLVTHCADGDSGWVACDDTLLVPKKLPPEVMQTYIQAHIRDGDEPPIMLSVVNPSLDSFLIWTPVVQLSPQDGTLSGDSIRLQASSPEGWLGPGDTAAIRFEPKYLVGTNGTYAGELKLAVLADNGQSDHYCLPVRLDFEVTTGIVGPGPSVPEPSQSPGLWVEAVGENEITMVLSGALVGAEGPMAGGPPGTSVYTIEVVNVLGQQMRFESNWLDGDGFFDRLAIRGSERWASGVYFCRVRIGNDAVTTRFVVFK